LIRRQRAARSVRTSPRNVTHHALRRHAIKPTAPKPAVDKITGNKLYGSASAARWRQRPPRAVSSASPGKSAAVAASIGGLGIHSAVCCPITLDSAVVVLIYLDSRGDEPGGLSDAVAFAHTASHLAGL